MQRPLTLTLCLTHNCNLRCRYCYAGRKTPQSMPWETARAGIELGLAEAERLGCSVDLSFFGGEPLLEWELLQRCHDYLWERRERLAPRRPRFGITTNATLLTQEKLAWLAERDFLVGLSVDGNAAMHNTNRRFADGRGSHAAVAEALELVGQFPALRRKCICVVNPANCHLLAGGVRWLHEHYEGDIGLNFDYWHTWTDAEFAVLTAQLEAVQQMMLAAYRAGERVPRVDNLIGKIHTHLNGKGCTLCRIGEQEIAVSAEGNLFPCSRLVGEGNSAFINFGHVSTGIDRAKQALLIAQRGNNTPACKLCGLRTRCMNGCGCTNYAASGQLNQVSPFLCACERLLIRLADDMAEQLYAERNPAFLQDFYGSRELDLPE